MNKKKMQHLICDCACNSYVTAAIEVKSLHVIECEERAAVLGEHKFFLGFFCFCFCLEYIMKLDSRLGAYGFASHFFHRVIY